MNQEVLSMRLQQASSAPDPLSAWGGLVEELLREGAELSDVKTILRFIEANPSQDFGTPGPLVHFVERFYRAGYEQEVVTSVQRRATTHNTWMLNRLINGAKSPEERLSLASVMRDVAFQANSDERTRHLARNFVAQLDG